MSKQKTTFIALASLALSTYGSFDCSLTGPAAVHAASKKKAVAVDNDGIDPSVRDYVNTGKWTEAIEKLQNLTASDSTCGRNEAWLAFAYLYTGKHDALLELDRKVQGMSANDQDPNCAAIVHAFALTQSTTGKDGATIPPKFDDAEKLLAGLKESEKGDALLDFAQACVALKKGNPTKAAEFCEKVVGICPNFAWGYRTLGFIQEKSLKNPLLAERAYEKALAASPDFKEVRNLLVDLRLGKNDFDGAIAATSEAIKLYPKDSANYYKLAQIYQQQWRLLEALDQLKKAQLLSKDDPRFYRAMATIYRYQGKLSDAVAEQQKAVDLSKDKAFELIELASLNEANNNLAAAIDNLNTAIKESPSNTVAHQKLVQLLKKDNRTDELIAEYKREIEIQPKVAPLRMSLAETYKQNGKLDEAVEQLKEAANLDQQNPKPHREIGKIEIKKKQFAAAAKSFTRALNISLGSRSADAGTVEDLVALGYCYAQNNDYMQAETAFTTGFAMLQLGATTGIQSTVNPVDILRSLGSVLLTEGRYREAVLNFEQVVASDKDGDQKKLDQFSLAQSKSLRDRTSDSLKDLQTSFNALDHDAQLSNLSDLVETYVDLGKKDLVLESVKKFPEPELKDKAPLALSNAWLMEDRFKEAKELLHKVIDQTKDDQETVASAYVQLAKAMIREGDRQSAVDALQKASENNPKDFDALVQLGKLYLTEKKNNESQQSAQKALEVNPYCVPAFLLIGENYAAMNKLKDAETNFQKAAELYPTSLEVHKALLSVFQKQSKSTEAQREQEIISNLSKNG
jgi:tetratricopeptide (TPR) repeat protein